MSIACFSANAGFLQGQLRQRKVSIHSRCLNPSSPLGTNNIQPVAINAKHGTLIAKINFRTAPLTGNLVLQNGTDRSSLYLITSPKINTMKKVTWSVILIFLTRFVVEAQAEYTNPAFDSLARDHKVLAILPFKVTLKLRPGKMKKMEIEDLNKIEKAEGEAAQRALQAYFLQQNVKDSFKVSFQDIAKTNALLTEMGWKNDSYRPKNTEEICRKLKVDGVITGTVFTSKLLSDGAAAVANTLNILTAYGIYLQDRTNKGTCTINIHDSKGELLWKYEKTLTRGMGSTTQSVINAMMRKVSKKFPYEDTK